jgi:SAM-dependent methyltransferase
MPSHAVCGAVAPRVTWETVACPLCAASDEEVLLTEPVDDGEAVYRLVRCRGCGMGYLNPRPDEDSIGQFYPEEYEPYQAPQRHRVGRWRQLVGPGGNSLTAVPLHGQGRLLDFGCGSGWYAQRMKERGWHVTGMDFSAHAARQVEQRYGIRVHVGTLPHPDVAVESFDMVTMGAVLEHVHDPHCVIAAARRALRPGGRLLVSVPNLAGWGFRYFGRDWFGLELPRHLLHFTPDTLRRLVEGHGLEVRELGTQVRGGWLRRSLARAHQRGSAVSRRPLARLGRLRVVSSLLAHWTGRTGQADAIRLIAERPA